MYVHFNPTTQIETQFMISILFREIMAKSIDPPLKVKAPIVKALRKQKSIAQIKKLLDSNYELGMEINHLEKKLSDKYDNFPMQAHAAKASSPPNKDNEFLHVLANQMQNAFKSELDMIQLIAKKHLEQFKAIEGIIDSLIIESQNEVAQMKK